MKVDNYKINYHCTSGTTIMINGKDCREYSKEELIQFFGFVIEQNYDTNLLEDILTDLFYYLPYSERELYQYKCEDCGDYNESIFYEVTKDNQ